MGVSVPAVVAVVIRVAMPVVKVVVVDVRRLTIFTGSGIVGIHVPKCIDYPR